jgi:hypothetical protein
MSIVVLQNALIKVHIFQLLINILLVIFEDHVAVLNVSFLMMEGRPEY